MKTKITKALSITLIIGLALALPVQAQNFPALTKLVAGEGFVRGWTAVSTEPKILIKYTGTNANGGTVTVASGGDITLSQGVVGSSVADASTECDASIAATGSRSGIFDLSTPNAACDTVGEIVDLINNQGTNWVAVIVNGLRTDATDNAFITLSEAAANSVDGLGLLNDGTVSLTQSIDVAPYAARSIKFYLTNGNTRQGRTLKANPFLGLTSVIYSMTATNTTSGAATHNLVCVAIVNSLTGGSSVATSYSKASGATTVEDTWTTASPFGGFSCPVGQKMMARTTTTTSNTVATLYAAGLIF